MKQKIDELLSGKFTYEQPGLLFSQEKISVTIPAGESIQSEIYLGTEEHFPIRGYISSSSRRLVPGMQEFSGETICLSYGADAVGLRTGERVEGFLNFTTNIGEYRLPFEIRTETGEIRSNSGSVRSLEAFRDIAQRDFREAFRIFTSASFEQLIQNRDPLRRARYKGFLSQPVTYQDLEEYLIASHLKNKVEISLMQDKAEFYSVSETRSELFTIQRSGWGHLRLEIEAKGSFLEPVRKVITDDDFIGSRYDLEYIIDRKKLAKGRQYGEILVKSPYEILAFPITASAYPKTDIKLRAVEKRHLLSMMKDYLEYQCGRTAFDEWAVSTHFTLNALKDSGQYYPEFQLYEAWLLHEEKKDDQAVQILSEYKDRVFTEEEIVLEGAYWYLSLVTGQISNYDQVITRIRNLYMMKGDSFVLLWFLLQLDHELTSPSRALYRMEELFERGCTSPFLYLEAWKYLREEPASMHTLSGFWIQVYYFAVRNGFLTEELSMRFVYLISYDKSFSLTACMVLEKCYELFPTDETLEGLCKYIIRGNPRRKEYFRWFSLAVERGLRITRLYEYYVETMDMSQRIVLPRSLLIYFKYNNDSLGDAKKAYLYANVITRRAEDTSTYGLYKSHMREFAEKSLSMGKMNEDYTILYREFYSQPDSYSDAAAIARVLFNYRVYCDNPRIRQVIVRCDQLVREDIYPLSKGSAFIRVYSQDSVILFQDEKQRRYETTVPYRKSPLFVDEDIARAVLNLGVDEPGLLLHFTENNDLSSQNLAIFERIVRSEAFTVEYRRKIRSRILDWFWTCAKDDGLDDYLRRIDIHEYVKVDKKKLLSILISRGLYDQAMKAVGEYGCEGLDHDEILRLVSREIENSDYIEDKELLSLASMLYHADCCDNATITYMIRYSQGPMSLLFSLRQEALARRLDTKDLEEKILCLLMFTDDYRKDGESVLEAYIRHDGDERVIGAYLTHLSYGIFVRDYAMSSLVLSYLLKVYQGQWKADRICRLALLKELSRGKARLEEAESIEQIEDDILAECMADEMSFGFFRRLNTRQLAPYQLDDKVFIEIHEDPKAKVTLFYRMDTGLGSQTHYRSEVLRNVYEGIFNRCFALFYGESIRYYFQVEKNGRTVKTSERVLSISRVENASVSKYQRINQMLSSRLLHGGKGLKKMITDYLRQEQYVKEMFHIR